MLVITWSSLLKSIDPKNLQKIIEKPFKNFSEGTSTFGTCVIASQGFAFSVPFNVIEMVKDFTVEHVTPIAYIYIEGLY